MKSLIEDINQKSFKKAYLLYGEESFLKNLYKNKLRAALMGDGDTMNLNVYEGKGINIKEVIDQAETMPFFADKRVIIMENSGFFKNAAPELAEYIPQLPEETCMIFVESEVDKRSKLFKTVKATGRIIELGRQDEKTLMNWVLSALRKEKRNITSATMQVFLSRTGNDMENIQRELEKLICYTMGRDVITTADVEAICTERTENKIFDMIQAIGEKRQKRALDLYYDLLALKEPPMRILFLLTRQFNLLMQTKELRDQGFDQNGIAGKLKMQSFIIRNYLRQTGNFTLEGLKQAVKDCVRIEEKVKTGRINDVLGVELMIVKYSSSGESS